MENPSTNPSIRVSSDDCHRRPELQKPAVPAAPMENGAQHSDTGNLSVETLVPPIPVDVDSGVRSVPNPPTCEHPESPGHDEQSPRKGKPAWRQWLPEISYSIASLCSFITIVAVLRAYHGHCLPKMPNGITLNTLLALFTTFSKAAFMAVVSEALSQWKWNLTCVAGASVKQTFDKLSIFSNVDCASRGTWGSWLLIWNLKFRHVITGAAALSLLSTFTSPITQQIIAYDRRPKKIHDEARTVFARDYVQDPDMYDNITDSVTRGMMGGFFSPVEHMAPHCGSNKCTFEPFTTLAACMRMRDISHTLEISRVEGSTSDDWTGIDPLTKNLNIFQEPATAWRARIPQVDMELVTPVSIAFVLDGRNRSIAFQDAHDNFTALSNLYLIWSAAGNVSYPGYNRTNEGPWRFHAVEILYHLCVNTYSLDYFKGTTKTTLLASSNIPLDIPGNQPLHCEMSDQETGYVRHCSPNISHHTGRLYLQDPNATLSPNHTTIPHYSIQRNVGNLVTETIRNLMPGLLMWNGRRTDPGLQRQFNARHIYRALMGGRVELEVFDKEVQIERLESYFEGMATSLTNLFRNSVTTSQQHNGTCWGEETFVQVRWGWLAFLGVEMLLSYLFLTATIHKTAKLGAPVLKSSELATLLASTPELCGAVGRIEELEDVKDKSKGVRIQLKEGKLVLRDD
ncbi:hypothetical protein OQA88_5195 [Cercophora sp. LCS_1]